MLIIYLSGGTSGCVVAGRLAEDASARVLVIEAGPLSEGLENVQMVGGYVHQKEKQEFFLIKPI